jgi:hypothetical protein
MSLKSNYWSCSKFADWIRGTDKGGAKTDQEWKLWHEQSSGSRPIRHWIAEEALDCIQNILMWPLDRLYDIKYYINNRWVTGTHALTAHSRDIPRGQWRDLGERFLPCMFNQLVDFVEVELAWKHVACDKEARTKYKVPWYGLGWFRWRIWRSAQAGIDYLNWEIDLVQDKTWGLGPDDDNYGEPTPQAQAALEILTLYRWWTEIYSQRQDPHDESGWSAACRMGRKNGGNFMDIMFNNTDPEYIKARDQAFKLLQEIETKREQEDTDMLVRLIKVRGKLWT